MKIKMPKLNKCPLCGGTPRYVKESVYATAAYRVECGSCHISTDYVLTGIDGLVGNTRITNITLSAARHNAGIAWNKLPIHRTSCLSTAQRMALCSVPIKSNNGGTAI